MTPVSDGEDVYGYLARYGRDDVAAHVHRLAQEQRAAAPDWKTRMAHAVRAEQAAEAAVAHAPEGPAPETPTPQPVAPRALRDTLRELSEQTAAALAAKQEAAQRRRQATLDEEACDAALASLAAQVALVARLLP